MKHRVLVLPEGNALWVVDGDTLEKLFTLTDAECHCRRISKRSVSP
ncbi:MAG: hypothetical protein ACNA8W_26745 [Bradymonadaceae bacterium]